ncbi:MAG TPA: SH3 domain-containing protein [Firmicutes bacterium]|nr:SH3 domain-containing protein [Bacillota bacterium]
MSTAFTDAVRRLLRIEQDLTLDYDDLVRRAPTLSQRACLERARSLQQSQITTLRWVLGEISGPCPTRRLRARIRVRIIVREAAFPGARIIREVPAGEVVEVIGEEDRFTRVRLPDGTVGFVEESALDMMDS